MSDVAMTEDEVRQMLRAHVKQAGSMRALAKEIGVSVAYISDILSGRRHPGPAIAKHYRLVIVTRFVRSYSRSPRE